MTRTILIVEDEAVIAMDLEARLTKLGYEVLAAAATMDEAVSLASRLRPDIILMDVHLDGPGDGIDAAAAIARFLDRPVVFLTAFGDQTTIARAATTLAYGYLMKPLDDRALSATLEIALRRHEADVRVRVLEELLAGAPLGVGILGAHGAQTRVLHANPAFWRLLFDLDVAASKELEDPFSALGGSAEARRLRDAIQAFAPARETLSLGEPDRGRVIDVSVVPSASAQGDPHLLVTCSDVTAERRAERAANNSQRLELVGRLAAGVAHDFNNLLAGILSFAELAQDDVTSAETAQDLQQIAAAARRGAALTRRLLSFSRRSRGWATGTSDLSVALEALRHTARHLVGPDVTFTLRASLRPIVVGLEAVSLEQIFLNLVSNARDATGTKGRIDVEVRERPEAKRVEVVVSDDGCGMDEDTARRVFEPFFTTKHLTGTGLGLWTTKSLVERAQGTISVRSAPGAGTTFTVELPMLDLDGAGLSQPPPDVSLMRGRRCLVVEGDAALRRAFTRALTNAGVSVTHVNETDAARDLLARAHPFDLLVVDNDLGRDAVQALLRHATERSATTRSVVLEGNPSETSPPPSPASRTLWKPFASNDLLRTAAELLRGEPPVAAAPASSPQPSTAELLVHGDVPNAEALATHFAATGVTAAVFEGRVEEAVFDWGRGAELVVVARPIPELAALSLRADARPRVLALSERRLEGGSDPALRQIGEALFQRSTDALRARLEGWSSAADAATSAQADAERDLARSLESVHVQTAPLVLASTRRTATLEVSLGSDGRWSTASGLEAAARSTGQMATVRERFVTVLSGWLQQNPDNVEPVLLDLGASSLWVAADPRMRAHASRLIVLADAGTTHGWSDPVLGTLRGRGLRVALADVGASPSSLDELHRVRPELALIAPGLIDAVEASPRARGLVEELSALAHGLQVSVAARHVRSETQASVLEGLGCDLLRFEAGH